ncbi:MAG: hypothetical protein NWR98_05775, partial [Litorivicinaceae bacterium]|nr:hypothetical protein [Litorivicinaceae bacterium]
IVHPPERLGSGATPQGHQLLCGPERLETGWWDGQPARRQYWITRTEDQRHAWVYQDAIDRQWWLSGWFN